MGIVLPSPSSPGLFPRLRLGSAQTAFSASLLLMVSALLSGALGLVRNKLIAQIFGVGPAVDAYNAAFELPDVIYYLLIGGVASTTFVKLLARYESTGTLEEGDRALSNILNVVGTGLALAIVAGEVLAPWYVRYKFHGFHGSEQASAMCVRMTRILLPNQLLLLAGGVFGSRLLSRKIFLYQAMQPLIYNGGIIAGGLLLNRTLGIYSLAVGAAAGALLGFFLINVVGARRIGMRWTPAFDLRHPTLREWLRLSLPLILGQSIVTLDPVIRSYFASDVTGGISLMKYSRDLFAAPMGIVGPAAGLASLPFFASLWTDGNIGRFSSAVNRSVSRLLGVSLLLTAWMVALSEPLINLALSGGRFRGHDATSAVQLFVLFCLSLVFWTSQNLYARAFYAAGDTLTPMLSGTVVTVLSLPLYALLFRGYGIAGLVVASDIAIAAHMMALAVSLHRKHMVSLPELEWPELGKALLAAVVSGLAISAMMHALRLSTTHSANLLRLLLGSCVGVAVAFGVLVATASALPQAFLRRRTAK